MKGHIRERSPGKWAIVIDVRDPETGKRRRRWHSFKGTKREAQTECSRLITAMAGGLYIEPSKTKLRDYLTQWLGHVSSSVSPRTSERYGEIVSRYLSPALGDVIMTKLQPLTIAAAYDTIRTRRTKGTGDLSAQTMLHCHRVLSSALRQAVRWRLLTFNPAADVRAPKVERRKPAIYSAPQTGDLLAALWDSWMHVPATLAVLCGLRRGEIAALRWGCIDLDKAQFAVIQSAERTRAGGVRYKPPKNDRVRTVALSSSVVAILRQHRLNQAERMLRLGVRLDDAAFVVAQANGSPYDPDSISKEWRLQVLKSGLPRIRFHDLRHTHGSALLRANVHPKIAQERLGHSRIGTTLDLYSHSVEGMQAGRRCRIG